MRLLVIILLVAIGYLLVASVAFAQTSTPYGGVPHPIPGILELENYDEGGPNVAYFDTSTTNEGNQYRTDGVDIGDLPEEGAGGNYSLGWLANTEWLKYTVNVSQAGPYELKIRGGLADYQAANPARFQIKLNDLPITGDALTSTFELYQSAWSWRGYSTLPKPGAPPLIVNLPAGQHVLKIEIVKSGGGGLNYLVFEPANVENYPQMAYPTPGSGQTYYVDPNGTTTNPGTLSQPWSLAKANSSAQAGDTVYLRGGTYTTRLTPTNSGSPDNYLVFKKYLQETPIIDGTNQNIPQLGGLVDITDKSYLQVSGLKIINTTGYWNTGVSLDNSHHIILDHNHLENTYSSGISTSRASHDILIDANTLTLTNQGGDDREVALGTYWFSYNVHITGNTISYGSGEGIGVAAGPHHVQVSGNTVHHMGQNRPGIGMYIDAWTEYQHHIDVFNNTVHTNPNEGISVANEAGGLQEHVDVYNNLIYNAGASFGGLGIVSWYDGSQTTANDHRLKHINLYHNTVTGNSREGSIFINNSQVEDINIKNNIIRYACASHNLNGVCLDYFYPHICTGTACDTHRDIIRANTQASNNLSGVNPLFVSSTNYHLQATSPAIDGGANVINSQFNILAPGFDFDGLIRPFGTGYDIGAFEFGSSLTPSPSTPSPSPSATPLPVAADLDFDGDVDFNDLTIALTRFGSATTNIFSLNTILRFL